MSDFNNFLDINDNFLSIEVSHKKYRFKVSVSIQVSKKSILHQKYRFKNNLSKLNYAKLIVKKSFSPILTF